jgi:RNA recognition motif-containing protein
MDRATMKPRGFAFVTMADDAGAQEAIRQLNGKDVGGRNITVSEARPQEDRPRRQFQGSGNGGNRRGSN